MANSRKPKYGSITKLMKELFKRHPEAKFEAAEKEVRVLFKASKFDRRHFSWYRCAFKRGALKGVR